MRASGLGDDWMAFRQALSRLRRAGHAVSHGEIDRGRVGLAAPVLSEDGRAIGSLSYVVAESAIDARGITRLTYLLSAAANEIGAALGAQSLPMRNRPSATLSHRHWQCLRNWFVHCEV
ncbi:IclR family transcriptional regulator domain-containing protein [Cupriavidus basilensis]